MPGLTDIPGTHRTRVRFPAEGTAGTDDTWSILKAEHDIEIVGARWIPDAAVTGAATNYFTFGLVNEGTDGSGTTAITDTLDYDNGSDAVAQVPEEFTLSSTAANLLVDAGEVISLARVTPGTGLASPAGVLEVEYQYV